MYSGKQSDQWLLTSHIHWRRGFKMQQPAGADVTVHRQKLKALASYWLVSRVFLDSGPKII